MNSESPGYVDMSPHHINHSNGQSLHTSGSSHVSLFSALVTILLIIIVLAITQDFFLSFLFTLIGYIIHTYGHLSQYARSSISHNKVVIGVLSGLLFVGWIAWLFMIVYDPVRPAVDEITAAAVFLVGFGSATLGFTLAGSARSVRKGFTAEDDLVTRGVYGYIRHPMYIGMILIHIGLPLAFLSLATTLSAILWSVIIFYWMKIDDKDLQKIYGEKYLQYRKKTLI